MKRVNKIFSIVIAISSVLLCGCSRKEEVIDRTDSNLLYSELKSVIALYTDSIAAASDSASIAATSERFEDKLTKINFKYPADTDMRMTEGQQDTLYKLTLKFTKIRQNRMRNITVRRDTINNDTVKKVF